MGNFKFKKSRVVFPRGNEKHATETQTKLIIFFCPDTVSCWNCVLYLALMRSTRQKKPPCHKMLKHRTYTSVWKYRSIMHMKIFLYNSLFHRDTFSKLGVFSSNKISLFSDSSKPQTPQTRKPTQSRICNSE